MFRLDAPHDSRNALGWHQDSSYYQMSYPKFNSGFCWIPLTINTIKNGTLMYVPKSHLNGFSEAKSVEKSSLRSQQLRVQTDQINKKEIINLNSNFGDASCFHMNIKHKSGINIKGKY